MNSFDIERFKTSVTTLANASELVAHVMIKVSGNDLSSTIGSTSDPKSLTPIGKMDMFRAFAQTRFQKNLNLA